MSEFFDRPARAARPERVDDLIGKQEVVIKSLGEMFGRQNAFAGAAILGDGRVGLMAIKVKRPAAIEI